MTNQTKQERLTSQKKIIADYLRSVKTHPSAETIFKQARKKLPRISLGTVYRVLNNLKKREEILEIPSEVSRYDGDISPHAHFICQCCKNIVDVFDKCHILKSKRLKVGKIKNYQIYFYGECKNCQCGR